MPRRLVDALRIPLFLGMVGFRGMRRPLPPLRCMRLSRVPRLRDTSVGDPGGTRNPLVHFRLHRMR